MFGRHLIAASLLLGLSGMFHASAAPVFKILGSAPNAPIIGAIRGSTLYGVNQAGTLFSFTTAGTVKTLHNFASADGSTLLGQLVFDGAGNLYGAAESGGQYGGGTLWEYAAKGTFSVRHNFGGPSDGLNDNVGDGSNPMQGPTIGPAGSIFGATGEGAIGGSGNVFRLTPQGDYASLHNFKSGADGHCPFTGVVRSAAGVLYGTTVGVGFGGNPTGSVWKMPIGGALKTLYVFKDGNDGEWPKLTPTLDSSGNLYGANTTKNGGEFPGSIWQISPAGTFKLLHVLNGTKEGYGPNSPLIFNTDGYLYGTTINGGPTGYGTVYRISPSGSFAVIYNFTNGKDGANPTGNLVHDAQGHLFGGTNSGQIFEITP